MLSKKEDPDCVSCRIIGTLSLSAIGGYIWYNSTKGRNANSKTMQVLLRMSAFGCFYLATARWSYLPPFDYLKEGGLPRKQ
uniref:DUF4536 domain-containing protein n=1 Tax=Panagrolaimus sp. JU765 TaxID=591449 RepID=A0AC34RBB0_9BILA